MTPKPCQQICVNIGISHECRCRKGYTLAADKCSCVGKNIHGSGHNKCLRVCPQYEWEVYYLFFNYNRIPFKNWKTLKSDKPSDTRKIFLMVEVESVHVIFASVYFVRYVIARDGWSVLNLTTKGVNSFHVFLCTILSMLIGCVWTKYTIRQQISSGMKVTWYSLFIKGKYWQPPFLSISDSRRHGVIFRRWCTFLCHWR